LAGVFFRQFNATFINYYFTAQLQNAGFAESSNKERLDCTWHASSCSLLSRQDLNTHIPV